MSEVIRESILTCPACNQRQAEVMPVDACLYFYECTRCAVLLKPKAADCSASSALTVPSDVHRSRLAAAIAGVPRDTATAAAADGGRTLSPASEYLDAQRDPARRHGVRLASSADGCSRADPDPGTSRRR